MRLSTLPQPPATPDPAPTPVPVPPSNSIGTFGRTTTTSSVNMYSKQEHVESTVATKGWVTQSDAQVWNGTFDAVQAQLMLAISRSDERNAEVDEDVYHGSGSLTRRIQAGDPTGQTPLHLVRATDDPTKWLVTAITAVEAVDDSHEDPATPRRYVERRIDANDPAGTSSLIAANTWTIAGLPEDARALVDSTRAVPVVEGVASWSTRGRDLKPNVFERVDPSGRHSALP
jgi:hypothetical protein